jgi:hypothetical protein
MAVDVEVSYPQAPQGLALSSPDSPTDAHRAVLGLLHEVLVEAARRRQEVLPGLVESLQDDVVLTTGGTSRPAYGWFAESTWRYGDRHVHELFLNADRRVPHPAVSAAEDVLVTLLHEACHVWAQLSGVRDTSRGGRYHNRRFAEIALAIGVAVEKDAHIGHHTPYLLPWARVDYADLLAELGRGLVLAREPRPAEPASDVSDMNDEVDRDDDAGGPAGLPALTTKYIFASCRCRDGRRRPVTIRVAKGSWRPDAIYCSMCKAPFAESL